MGVGIVRAGNRVWATEDFATSLQSLSSEDFERTIEQQISSRRRDHRLGALKVSHPPELRRIACSGEGSAGAAFGALPHQSQASAFNFTTPNPNNLPANLVKKLLELPSGSYSIGACATKADSSGLSTFRVLVVLYR